MSIELTDRELMALKVINRHFLSNGSMPSVRMVMEALSYNYPRSAALVIDRLVEKGFLKKRSDGKLQLVMSDMNIPSAEQTIDVPLIGNVACGLPILAEQNIEAMYPVSTKLAPPSNKYYLLRAKGDSMDERGIKDGDLVLVKQKSTAENGEIIVALTDDTATIKEYRRQGDTVILIPHSSNPAHKPIILTSDFKVQGVVVATIPKWTT
jgi:repressor LexA